MLARHRIKSPQREMATCHWSAFEHALMAALYVILVGERGWLELFDKISNAPCQLEPLEQALMAKSQQLWSCPNFDSSKACLQCSQLSHALIAAVRVKEEILFLSIKLPGARNASRANVHWAAFPNAFTLALWQKLFSSCWSIWHKVSRTNGHWSCAVMMEE